VRNYAVLKNFTLVSGSHKTAKIQTQIDEFFVNPNTITFATDGSFSHSIGTTEVALMGKILENSFDVYSLVEVQ
jgi:hypothetical protein